MRTATLVLSLVLSSLPVSAIAEGPLPEQWVCTSGQCNCQPKLKGKFGRITARGGVLTIENECGEIAKGTRQGTSILVPKWNATGVLSSDSITITWSFTPTVEFLGKNQVAIPPALRPSATWTKRAIHELEERLAYWEKKAFYCDTNSPSKIGFPSKENEARNDCDDGDPVIENALLCLAGDERGCSAVQRSQDKDGRWWRSPRKARTRPPEPPPIDLKDLQDKGTGQTTFSTDHAIGVWAYITQKANVGAFEQWVNWIDKNPRCLTFCGALPIGTPRFCGHDKCAFTLVDCPMMQMVGSLYRKPVKFCSLAPIPVPPIESLAEELRKLFSSKVGKLALNLPSVQVARAAFEESMKAYNGTFKKLHDQRSLLEQEIVKKVRIANIVTGINSRINNPGYSRHNAMVMILLLEKWGNSSRELTKAAQNIADAEPKNPFFEYVAYRKTRGDTMLKKILDVCPSEMTDKNHARIEWAWERKESERAWEKTMYWDCIFVAKLWNNPSIEFPEPKESNFFEKMAAEAFERLQKDLKEIEKRAREIIANLPDANPINYGKNKIDEKLKDPTTPPDPVGKTIHKDVKREVENFFKGLSDARLKTDILRIGVLPNGVNLYRFRYLWSDVVHVGVLAHEVRVEMPGAVWPGRDGYWRVDYAKIGTELLTLREWESRSRANLSR